MEIQVPPCLSLGSAKVGPDPEAGIRVVHGRSWCQGARELENKRATEGGNAYTAAVHQLGPREGQRCASCEDRPWTFMKCISELGVGETEENRKHLSIVSHHPLAKCDPTGINSPVSQDKHNEFMAIISEKPQGRKRRLCRTGWGQALSPATCRKQRRLELGVSGQDYPKGMRERCSARVL